MKDSKGKKISIGDRVKVLWGFDNRLYFGKITNINKSIATVATMNSRISTNNQSKITRITEN